MKKKIMMISLMIIPSWIAGAVWNCLEIWTRPPLIVTVIILMLVGAVNFFTECDF